MCGSLTSPTILVVDDDVALLKLLKALLDGAGFRVLTAASPSEALETCRRIKIDLLLTEVRMPDLAGPELALQVVRFAPDTRVLFMSGCDTSTLAEGDCSWIEYGLLRKPFSPADLLNAVDGALDLFSAGGARHQKAHRRPDVYHSAKGAAV